MSAPGVTHRRPPPLRPVMEHGVAVRLTEQLSDRLDAAAAQAGVSRSSLIRGILSSVLPPAATP